MSANAINSGAALPSIVGDYRVIIRWAFVRIPTRSQVFDWGFITGGAMAKLEIACAQDPTLDRRMPRQLNDARPAIPHCSAGIVRRASRREWRSPGHAASLANLSQQLCRNYRRR